MVEATPSLFEEALAMNSEARAQLAELLLDSPDEIDPAPDQLWLEEAGSRVAAYQTGTMKALTTEEFFRGMNQS